MAKGQPNETTSTETKIQESAMYAHKNISRIQNIKPCPQTRDPVLLSAAFLAITLAAITAERKPAASISLQPASAIQGSTIQFLFVFIHVHQSVHICVSEYKTIHLLKCTRASGDTCLMDLMCSRSSGLVLNIKTFGFDKYWMHGLNTR